MRRIVTGLAMMAVLGAAAATSSAFAQNIDCNDPRMAATYCKGMHNGGGGPGQQHGGGNGPGQQHNGGGNGPGRQHNDDNLQFPGQDDQNPRFGPGSNHDHNGPGNGPGRQHTDDNLQFGPGQDDENPRFGPGSNHDHNGPGPGRPQHDGPGMGGPGMGPGPMHGGNWGGRDRDEFRNRFRHYHFGPFGRPNFPIRPGYVVPRYYGLRPLPPDLFMFYPFYRGFLFFETPNGSIVIVDPRTYEIVAII